MLQRHHKVRKFMRVDSPKQISCSHLGKPVIIPGYVMAAQGILKLIFIQQEHFSILYHHHVQIQIVKPWNALVCYPLFLANIDVPLHDISLVIKHGRNDKMAVLRVIL